jgi:hypothetical protein
MREWLENGGDGHEGAANNPEPDSTQGGESTLLRVISLRYDGFLRHSHITDMQWCTIKPPPRSVAEACGDHRSLVEEHDITRLLPLLTTRRYISLSMQRARHVGNLRAEPPDNRASSDPWSPQQCCDRARCRYISQ